MASTPVLIDIPKHEDHRGNLSVIDSSTCLPFDIKRIFYVYDIPSGVARGGHAHYTLHQFIWCVSGSISVSTVSCNAKQESFSLSLPWRGLYLPPLTWASETAQSGGCVYMVAASDYYDETDYIRDYSFFMGLASNK